VSSPEVIARFDELFERRHPSRMPESGVLLERIWACSRAENRAAAAQLAAIGELFAYRLWRCSETKEWAVDTEAAVGTELPAALRISQGLAASRMRCARAAAAGGRGVQGGGIDFGMFATMVYRTDLLTDRDVLAVVDAQLAVQVAGWPSITRGGWPAKSTRSWAGPMRMRCAGVGAPDPAGDLDRGSVGGLSEIHGSLLTPEAHARDQALDGVAAGVCERNPGSRKRRRAEGWGRWRRGGSAGLSLRAPGLRRRKAAGRLAGGDSCDRRAGHSYWDGS
jgi:hypothetical protein